MNKLPAEILHNIFIELSLNQKQECMFVCSRWEYIIREQSLFHTIYIPSKRIYKLFLKHIQEKPSRRAQVECIRTHHDLQPIFDKVELPNLFPNIRLFESRQAIHIRSMDIIYKKKKIAGTEPWSSLSNGYIEQIYDYKTCNFMHMLVNSGQCLQLVTLKLLLRDTKELLDDVLNSLKYMPVLKNLILKGGDIRSTDFETIHTNSPLLESLELHDTIFLPFKELKNISPAPSMIKFSNDFFEMNNRSDRPKWLNYIHKKYPFLKHFYFSEGFDNNIDAQDLCKNEYISLVQSLGSHLKSLYLTAYEYNGVNFIKHLDDSGCQLNDLKLCGDGKDTDIITALECSNQISYLEKLSVNRIYPSSFDWIKKMTKLKELTIIGFEWVDDVNSSKYIDLNLFFESCSQAAVDSVKIHLGKIESTTIINPHQQFRIKKLEFGSIHPPPGFDKYISTCFPYLQTLILHKCLEDDSTLNLPSCHLLRLEINICNNLSLTTLNDNKTHHYIMGSGGIRGGIRRSKKKQFFFRYLYDKYRKKDIIDYTILSDETAPYSLDTIECKKFTFLNVICGSVKELVWGSFPTSFIPRRQ